MLSNNNHNHKTCAFAEQMVSYLYGEINAGDDIKFETHLKNCSACADELADFGSVRSSVHDWRVTEFSNLETPIFHIPANNRAASFSTVSSSNENASWFTNLRRIFSFNPAWATAALGILVVCAGITFFAFYFSSSSEIAEKSDDKNSVQPTVLPSIESTIKTEERNIVVQGNEQLPPSSVKDSNSSPKIKRERQVVSDKSIVKVSNNAQKNETDDSVRNSKNAAANIKKTSPVQKRRVPTLINTDEEEDDSIRLADLFAEIDAK